MQSSDKRNPDPTWLDNWGNNIAVKITAPVFWILIPLGLIIAVVVQNKFASDLPDILAGDANHLAYVASRHLTNLEGGQPLDLHKALEQHMSNMMFVNGEISVGVRTIFFGDPEQDRNGLEKISRRITYTNKLQNGDGLTTEMVLYHKPEVTLIKEKRKNLLVKFGLGFFLFGVILTWLINSVVTRPINELLSATKAVAEGDLSSRLNINRKDEFGKLTEFFNEMLDKLQNKQEELSLAVKVAESASNAKTTFLANMSHEIRTPLTAIIGFSNLLKNDKFSPEERRKHLETIIHGGFHLEQIINDILDMSKIEAGQLVIDEVECSLFTLVRQVEEMIRPKAMEKNIKLQTRFKFPLPHTIKIDSTRLKQVLLNLCSNSIKFTEEGQIDIYVEYLAVNNKLQIDVADTGVGMTEVEVRRLFVPFSQADSSTTRQYGGTGLGLCICRELINSMGGDICCQSRKGIGTKMTFTVDIGEISPEILVDSYSETFEEFKELDDTIKPDTLSGRVLFAEDTLDNQKLISMYIKRTGAKVTVVENGKQALDTALTEDFDLILMDIQMPVMGGDEAIARLRAAGYKNPIVALTANALKEDQDKCRKAGVDDYLTKPIDPCRFNAVLRRYLPQREKVNQAATVSNEQKAGISSELRDDPEFLKLVKQFEANLPGKIVEINKAYQEQDWSELKNQVHKLKGTASSFGYGDLSDISSDIQNAIVDKNYNVLASLVEDLLDCFRSHFPYIKMSSNF